MKNLLDCRFYCSVFCGLSAILFGFGGDVYGAIFTVNNTNNSGVGSFRQALLDANANAGSDSIVFNIAPGGIQTISLSTNLPRISSPVIIDATTQPGYTANPIIELRGTGSSGTANALAIDAGNSTIRGLIINNSNLGGIGIFTNGGNRIENNFIGINSAGTAAQSNFGEGIRIFNSSNNIIGGIAQNARNIISGNSSGGISVGGDSAGNIFQGNYIGTDVIGTAAIPNGREGICLCGSGNNNVIGGTAANSGNLIAGNGFDEIRISGASIGNSIQGNLIGTNAAGTQAIPSNGYGISLENIGSNVIGGTAATARNIISGNIDGSYRGGSGISIERSSNNIIQGNYIGTDQTGTTGLPNSAWGIRIFENSQNNVIGGTAPGGGNIVAFNGRTGIIMGKPFDSQFPVSGNAVRGNSLFSNGGLGIDLADGTSIEATANDPCDADAGVNNLQNYPILAMASSNGTSVNIVGSLNSAANTTFAVDFFSSPNFDGSEFGEGKTYIGSAAVSTAGDCNATFIVRLPHQVGGGNFITATATDAAGNTSEFSRYIQSAAILSNPLFDFDGDGKSDLSVFRPANGAWYLLQSQNGFTGVQFGTFNDKIVPADYDGDGKTDLAVYRNGTWYLQRSQSGFTGITFGVANDIPVPADYDGDGRTDLAVFRPGDGTWYLQQSTNGFNAVAFGQIGDKPVASDYDGDGKADLAVNRNGIWYIQRSQLGFFGIQFGTANDKLVPADYDGDNKADIAVFRPSNGTWYLQQSAAGFAGVSFGLGTDLPVPADYDGDGKTDVAVVRGSTWYLQRSSQGFTGIAFGTAADQPIPNAFIR